MDQRILYGCIAALGVMLGFDLLTQLAGMKLDAPIRTPAGTVYAGDAAVTFAAMTLGAWLARRDFRWTAVGLSLVLWLATIVVLYSVAMPSDPGASVPAILKFNALAIVLGVAASWLGAMLGQRLAARDGVPAAS